MNYGGFWIRFIAYVIDSAIVVIIFAAIMLLLGVMGLELAGPEIIITVIGVLYVALMQSSKRQATLGKALCGLKVGNANGERISVGRSLGREVAKIISAIPLLIGFIIAAFTRNKQALHDLVATTYVVRDNPGRVTAAVALAVLILLSPIVLTVMFGAAMLAPMMGPMAELLNEQPAGMSQPKPAAPQPPKPVAAAPATAVPAGGKPAAEPPKPAPTVVGAAPAAPATPPAASAVPAKPATAAPAQPPEPSKSAPAPVKEPAKVAAPALEVPPAPAPVAEAPVEPKPAPRREPAPAVRPAVQEEAAPAPRIQTAAAPVQESTIRFNDLVTAVLFRDAGAVNELLAFGKWADKPDSQGMTPLMIAAQNGDTAIAEALLKAGANPNRTGPGGVTAISLARDRKDATMLGLLQGRR